MGTLCRLQQKQPQHQSQHHQRTEAMPVLQVSPSSSSQLSRVTLPPPTFLPHVHSFQQLSPRVLESSATYAQMQQVDQQHPTTIHWPSQATPYSHSDQLQQLHSQKQSHSPSASFCPTHHHSAQSLPTRQVAAVHHTMSVAAVIDCAASDAQTEADEVTDKGTYENTDPLPNYTKACTNEEDASSVSAAAVPCSHAMDTTMTVSTPPAARPTQLMGPYTGTAVALSSLGPPHHLQGGCPEYSLRKNASDPTINGSLDKTDSSWKVAVVSSEEGKVQGEWHGDRNSNDRSWNSNGIYGGASGLNANTYKTQEPLRDAISQDGHNALSKTNGNNVASLVLADEKIATAAVSSNRPRNHLLTRDALSDGRAVTGSGVVQTLQPYNHQVETAASHHQAHHSTDPLSLTKTAGGAGSDVTTSPAATTGTGGGGAFIGRKPRGPNKKSEQLPKTIRCTYLSCSSMFNRQEHLTRHLRMHTGERPFLCTFVGCHKTFTRTDNLAAHVKSHAPITLRRPRKASPAISDPTGCLTPSRQLHSKNHPRQPLPHQPLVQLQQQSVHAVKREPHVQESGRYQQPSSCSLSPNRHIHKSPQLHHNRRYVTDEWSRPVESESIHSRQRPEQLPSLTQSHHYPTPDHNHWNAQRQYDQDFHLYRKQHGSPPQPGYSGYHQHNEHLPITHDPSQAPPQFGLHMQPKRHISSSASDGSPSTIH
ncbi:hypothetical protein BASA81_007643 [Batrachochytrium salamandrivorans]|nr:hypothetical protein BASA81_007643 [Batrachochytrium salamandrivorans]